MCQNLTRFRWRGVCSWLVGYVFLWGRNKASPQNCRCQLCSYRHCVIVFIVLASCNLLRAWSLTCWPNFNQSYRGVLRALFFSLLDLLAFVDAFNIIFWAGHELMGTGFPVKNKEFWKNDAWLRHEQCPSIPKIASSLCNEPAGFSRFKWQGFSASCFEPTEVSWPRCLQPQSLHGSSSTGAFWIPSSEHTQERSLLIWQRKRIFPWDGSCSYATQSGKSQLHLSLIDAPRGLQRHIIITLIDWVLIEWLTVRQTGGQTDRQIDRRTDWGRCRWRERESQLYKDLCVYYIYIYVCVWICRGTYIIIRHTCIYIYIYI